MRWLRQLLVDALRKSGLMITYPGITAPACKCHRLGCCCTSSSSRRYRPSCQVLSARHGERELVSRSGSVRNGRCELVGAAISKRGLACNPAAKYSAQLHKERAGLRSALVSGGFRTAVPRYRYASTLAGSSREKRCSWQWPQPRARADRVYVVQRPASKQRGRICQRTRPAAEFLQARA